MVSDSELVERLHEFLRTSDLNITTTAIVRRQLEEDFGIDLSDKKAFIREQVDLFLQSQLEKADEEEEGNAGADNEGKRKIKSEARSGSDSDEEEDNEEEETSIGRGSGKGASSKPTKDVKKRGGFTKLCALSPQLQKFVGVPELARTEVVKQIWAYIRENDMQDPSNRRNIICDETLRELFRVDSINMFQMNKALSKHIWPLDPEDGQARLTQKEKQRKQERKEGPNDPRPKEKRQKGGNSGFLAPLQLSDALVKFIGTGESTLSRAGVVKRMWEYIKQNNLQDPSNKRMILCDEKLKELFEVDSFNGFTVPKLLATHFIKPEQVCCTVLDLDIKIIGKKIYVLAWNFIPFKAGGGFLEIIKWSLPNSSTEMCRSSYADAFLLASASLVQKEHFEPRSSVVAD